MKLALLGILACAVPLFAQSDDSTDLNVNSRYTVESIGFTNQRQFRLSKAALEQMQRLIGARLNTDALNRLAKNIASEVRAHSVTFKVARGGEPDSVKVLFTVDQTPGSFDLSIPRFSYDSLQGWSGVGKASATFGDNAFTVNLLTSNDAVAERYSGVQAKYQRLAIAGDRIQLGFEFDAYREQYSPATLAALQASTQSSSLGAGAYSSSLNFEPSATFVLARPLTFTTGLGFEQLTTASTAARLESANAVINTLRYRERWGDSDSSRQELEAGYNLRAATKLLGTDLVFSRHLWNARYLYVRERQSVEVTLSAGVIYGRAPIEERFVLGTSTTLRGWNKYELDPLGGNRMAYGSVTYGYRKLRIFYDTGSVWDQGKSPEARQSVGVGVAGGLGVFERDAFLLAMAFPIRQGRIEPVLIAGMNF